MVSRNGIVGSLEILKKEGVYIDFEEFKLQKGIKRKGEKLNFKKRDFLNYGIFTFDKAIGRIHSGGTRGSLTEVVVGTRCFRQRLLNEMIMLRLHNIINTHFIVWLPALLTTSASLVPLRLLKFKVNGIEWFTPIMEKNFINRSYFFIKYKLLSYVTNGTILRYDYLPYEKAESIVNIIKTKKKKGLTCSIWTTPSSAARISIIARKKGFNIEGSNFIVCSEPLTKKKREEIKKVNCKLINTYYFTEGGLAGFSCNRDEEGVHLLKDNFEIIQDSNYQNNDNKSAPFYFTSFYSGAPVLMLNMANGDEGRLINDGCGCKLDKYGLYSKLTGISSYKFMNVNK
jgi:hypothetical protein